MGKNVGETWFVVRFRKAGEPGGEWASEDWGTRGHTEARAEHLARNGNDVRVIECTEREIMRLDGKRNDS
jgi:hypothetical protein